MSELQCSHCRVKLDSPGKWCDKCIVNLECQMCHAELDSPDDLCSKCAYELQLMESLDRVHQEAIEHQACADAACEDMTTEQEEKIWSDVRMVEKDLGLEDKLEADVKTMQEFEREQEKSGCFDRSVDGASEQKGNEEADGTGVPMTNDDDEDQKGCLIVADDDEAGVRVITIDDDNDLVVQLLHEMDADKAKAEGEDEVETTVCEESLQERKEDGNLPEFQRVDYQHQFDSTELEAKKQAEAEERHNARDRNKQRREQRESEDPTEWETRFGPKDPVPAMGTHWERRLTPANKHLDSPPGVWAVFSEQRDGRNITLADFAYMDVHRGRHSRHIRPSMTEGVKLDGKQGKDLFGWLYKMLKYEFNLSEEELNKAMKSQPDSHFW